MLLDFLYDVFLLYLALETPQGIFKRLSFLKPHFSHAINTPNRCKDSKTTDVAVNVEIVSCLR